MYIYNYLGFLFNVLLYSLFPQVTSLSHLVAARERVSVFNLAVWPFSCLRNSRNRTLNYGEMYQTIITVIS